MSTIPSDNSKFVEQVLHHGKVLAIIVRAQFNNPGIHFFTTPDFSQQLAYINHPPGKVIDAHYHIPRKCHVELTQEVLIIKKGKLRVDFYRDDQSYLESRILSEGDIILLAQGAHGFEVLEHLEMVEVKQGPYTGEEEKVRFTNSRPGPLKIVS